MSIFDTSLPDEDEQIELVTLHSDISAGIGMTDSLRFPNVRAALDHARALSQDERDRTFIRCGQKVQTLEAAERLMSGAGQGDEVPLAPNLP